MALKDWKKIQSGWINRWVNPKISDESQKINLVDVSAPTDENDWWNVNFLYGKRGNITGRKNFWGKNAKSQALKYAKAYMRKH